MGDETHLITVINSPETSAETKTSAVLESLSEHRDDPHLSGIKRLLEDILSPDTEKYPFDDLIRDRLTELLLLSEGFLKKDGIWQKSETDVPEKSPWETVPENTRDTYAMRLETFLNAYAEESGTNIRVRRNGDDISLTDGETSAGYKISGLYGQCVTEYGSAVSVQAGDIINGFMTKAETDRESAALTAKRHHSKDVRNFGTELMMILNTGFDTDTTAILKDGGPIEDDIWILQIRSRIKQTDFDMEKLWTACRENDTLTDINTLAERLASDFETDNPEFRAGTMMNQAQDMLKKGAEFASTGISRAKAFLKKTSGDSGDT